MNRGVRGGGRAPPLLRRLWSRGGLRGAGSPPLRGSGQRPRKNLFGPYIRLGRPTYGFVHDFRTWFWMQWFSVHGFGHDGFRSMVLDASTCINMYCNIERKIMKKIKLVVPVLGSRGKSLCICVLCVMLSHCLFSVF